MKTPGMCLVYFFLLSAVLFIKDSKAESYEYLQFVLQYPRGACLNDNKCKPTASLPAKFTMHGIWPTNISTTKISCDQAAKQHPFDKNLITPLKPDLHQSWPSVKTARDDMAFWRHEYNKHGSCTAPAISQRAYFKRANEFWKEYDLYTILAQNNIKPGPSKSYSRAKFEAAVKSKIGSEKIPVILCKKTNLTASRKPVLILREIVICFDHQGTNLVNCNRSSDCNLKGVPSNNIYYI